MEEETSLTAEKSRKDVAAAIRKYSVPEFVFLMKGKPMPLEMVIATVEKNDHPPKSSRIHDRVFIRKGETIVVYALYDRTLEVGGKIKEIKDQRFFEVFVPSDGTWKFLFSGIGF